MMHHYTVPVPTATCSGCWGPITKNLETFSDIKELSVKANPSPNAIGGLISFKLSPKSPLSLDEIIESISSAGHDVEKTDFTNHSLIINQEKHHALSDALDKKKTQQSQQQHLKNFLISSALGIPLLLLSALGITLPIYAMWAIATLSCIAVFYTGKELFGAGIKSVLSSGTPTMHTLFTISVLTAVSVSIAALFVPMLPFEFASALLILSSHHIGKYIETRMKQVVGATIDIKSRLPNTIQRKKTNEIGITRYETIYLSDIKIGDELLLNEHEYLPVDGKLLNKSASFKKTFRNGSLLAETIPCNEDLKAGIQLMSQNAWFNATSTYADSSLRQWEKQLKQAQKEQANTKVEEFNATIIKYFIPGVLIISALVFSMTLPFFGPLVALHSGIAILVGACPCTLGFIIPLAVHVGREKSKLHGAIINKRETIEIASNVTHVIFDLNGTLTEGVPKVNSMKTYGTRVNKDTLLHVISLMESSLPRSHAIGNALKDFAEKNCDKSKPKLKLSNFTQSACGIKGTINDDVYTLGNDCFMNDEGILINNKPNQQYLAKNGKLIAHFDIIDPIRADAKQTVAQLQSRGIIVILCSGASPLTVEHHAKSLNISRFHANQRSDKKETLIKTLQEKGHIVAMVGDGINDTVALTASNVGIALANADEFSKAAADVLIEKESLLPIAHFFKNSQSTFRVIQQNLLFSLIYNVAVIVLTVTAALFLGSMAPAVMALSMGLQSLLILANTYRLKEMPLAEQPMFPKQEANHFPSGSMDAPHHTPIVHPSPPSKKWTLSSLFNTAPLPPNASPNHKCCERSASSRM